MAKVCAKCHKEKSLDEFQADSRYRCGVHSQCKECRKEYQKWWNARNTKKNTEDQFRKQKRCPRCGEVKPPWEFASCPSKKSGLSSRCKSCRLKSEKRSKRQMLKDRLKTLYQMTTLEYDKLLIKQDRKCAICGIVMNKPCVDHNHSTGKIRGLLCVWCNTRLSALEDPRFYDSARRYLNG